MEATFRQTAGERAMRTCIRDLVALSSMPAWWVGQSAASIAESGRDLLAGMMRAEVAYVRVARAGGTPVTATMGATAEEIEAGEGEVLMRGETVVRLAYTPIGLAGEHGHLAVGSSRSGFPTETESLLLQVAAREMAVALRHAELLARHQAVEDQLRVRATQQAAMAGLSANALTGRSIDEVLIEASRILCDTLHTDYCEVLELDDKGESLLLRAGQGWRPGLVGHTRISASRDTQAGFTLMSATPIIVHDFRKETRFSGSSALLAHGALSGMTVIIHDDSRPFGVLGVHSRALRAFSPDDVNFLQGVANLLGVARQRDRAEAEQTRLLRETQRAVVGRDRAVRIVSHDLGNPLSTVQICAAALLDVEPPALGGVRKMAEIIQRSASWMQQIVLDLRDGTSLETGTLVLDRKETSVSELLTAASAVFAPMASERALNFAVESDPGIPAVYADQRRLLQVLFNLLGNAMKFSPRGQDVVLSARKAGDSGRADFAASEPVDGVRFSVTDTGPGIPAQDLPHVTDWLWRSQSASGSGTGLGLAIAKGLVEAHGGKLRIESVFGQGTTCSFTIPTANAGTV